MSSLWQKGKKNTKSAKKNSFVVVPRASYIVEMDGRHNNTKVRHLSEEQMQTERNRNNRDDDSDYDDGQRRRTKSQGKRKQRGSGIDHCEQGTLLPLTCKQKTKNSSATTRDMQSSREAKGRYGSCHALTGDEHQQSQGLDDEYFSDNPTSLNLSKVNGTTKRKAKQAEQLSLTSDSGRGETGGVIEIDCESDEQKEENSEDEESVSKRSYSEIDDGILISASNKYRNEESQVSTYRNTERTSHRAQQNTGSVLEHFTSESSSKHVVRKKRKARRSYGGRQRPPSSHEETARSTRSTSATVSSKGTNRPIEVDHQLDHRGESAYSSKKLRGKLKDDSEEHVDEITMIDSPSEKKSPAPTHELHKISEDGCVRKPENDHPHDIDDEEATFGSCAKSATDSIYDSHGAVGQSSCIVKAASREPAPVSSQSKKHEEYEEIELSKMNDVLIDKRNSSALADLGVPSSEATVSGIRAVKEHMEADEHSSSTAGDIGKNFVTISNLDGEEENEGLSTMMDMTVHRGKRRRTVVKQKSEEDRKESTVATDRSQVDQSVEQIDWFTGKVLNTFKYVSEARKKTTIRSVDIEKMLENHEEETKERQKGNYYKTRNIGKFYWRRVGETHLPWELEVLGKTIEIRVKDPSDATKCVSFVAKILTYKRKSGLHRVQFLRVSENELAGHPTYLKSLCRLDFRVLDDRRR